MSLNLCCDLLSYCTDLHEQVKPLVFLLLSLDELQSRRLVTAEGTDGLFDFLLLFTAELESTQKHVTFTLLLGFCLNCFCV